MSVNGPIIRYIQYISLTDLTNLSAVILAEICVLEVEKQEPKVGRWRGHPSRKLREVAASTTVLSANSSPHDFTADFSFPRATETPGLSGHHHGGIYVSSPRVPGKPAWNDLQ